MCIHYLSKQNNQQHMIPEWGGWVKGHGLSEPNLEFKVECIESDSDSAGNHTELCSCLISQKSTGKRQKSVQTEERHPESFI